MIRSNDEISRGIIEHFQFYGSFRLLSLSTANNTSLSEPHWRRRLGAGFVFANTTYITWPPIIIHQKRHLAIASLINPPFSRDGVYTRV
jgi:hypothetical protein